MIRYWRAYLFVFDSPRWLANLGSVTLCILSTAIIPVVSETFSTMQLRPDAARCSCNQATSLSVLEALRQMKISPGSR